MSKIIVKNAVKRKYGYLYYIDQKGNLCQDTLSRIIKEEGKESLKNPCVQCEEVEAEYIYIDNKYCEECLENYYVGNRMYENYSFNDFLMMDCKEITLDDKQQKGDEQ